MIDIVILSFIYLSFALGGLNPRALSDGIVFSVGVLGGHASIRKMSLNALAYLLGILLIIVPVVVGVGVVVRGVIELSGRGYILAALIISMVSMVSSVVNILRENHSSMTAVGAPVGGFLKKKRVSLSRSVGTFRTDLLFGLLSGGRIIVGELGALIGCIWLLESVGGFSLARLILACLLLSGFMVIIFMMLLYGVNVAELERLRKRFALKISLIGSLAGVMISWSVLAYMMGLI